MKRTLNTVITGVQLSFFNKYVKTQFYHIIILIIPTWMNNIIKKMLIKFVIRENVIYVVLKKRK